MNILLAFTLLMISISSSANTTLSGDQYVALLEERTLQWQQAVYEQPNSLPLLSQLAPSIYRLGVYAGDLYRVSQAIGYMSRAIILAEKNNAPALPQLYLSRAAMHLTLHQFSRASYDIERAEQLGNDPPILWLLQGELYWNLGDYNKAQGLIKKAANQAPNLRSMTRLAIFYFRTGRYEEAQKIFNDAEKHIDVTNPIQTAWYYVQWGITYLDHQQFTQAETYFRQATSIAPNYVLALEHLAETLASQGKITESIGYYQHVLTLSNSPEFVSALADVYKEQGDTEKANTLAEQAKTAYDELLAFFPEAMYQHAADFYHAYGEHQTALKLLKSNTSLRPNSESYHLLAQAQWTMGQTAQAQQSLLQALKGPLISPELCQLGAQVQPSKELLKQYKPNCL